MSAESNFTKSFEARWIREAEQRFEAAQLSKNQDLILAAADSLLEARLGAMRSLRDAEAAARAQVRS